MNYLVSELEIEDEPYQQHDLRLVFMSGDWIPVQLPDRLKKYFPQATVISLGGATEGTVWSNYYPVEKVPASWNSIPYGKPIWNNYFYILDEHQQPVPKGVVGELYIGGVGVARGYANDEQKTGYSFLPDPFNSNLGGRMYRTGDLGRMLPDENMEFLGRTDNQVKVRGYRVELGEIESTLQKHEHVREAIVNVYKDAANNNQLCAYLVLREPVSLQPVKDHLKSMVPGYMLPNQYMVLDALPLTSNGKINRKALPDPAKDTTELQKDHAAPVTELNKQVSSIWNNILNMERISINDNLFDLGANSLSVGAFVNRIAKEMNIALNIQEVFDNPTIEMLSEEIDRIRWANSNQGAINDNSIETISI
jgi:acyl-coenzyme A synthetase/AMP-(fatty) acid ligase/acyl carrier protein